jgi:hypothetical protein
MVSVCRGVPATWLAVTCVFCFRIAAAGPAAPQPQRIDLLTDLPAAGDLAAPANGQTLYVLDEANGQIVAIDPFEPGKRWTAVAAEQPQENRQDDQQQRATAVTLAIGCIDTSMLAMLRRDRQDWSLHTHRLQPGVAADPNAPAQRVVVGRVAGKAVDRTAGETDRADAAPAANRIAADVRACLTVSPSRDWLGICGLPAPLPAVMRAPIAGARIGNVSARGCPLFSGEVRPTVATISTAEELVLFATAPDERDPEKREPDEREPDELDPEKRDSGERAAAGTFVSFSLPPDPRRLLHLDTSLPEIRDAAFCRADGTLWVVGGGPTGESSGDPASATAPEGLWRIDAVLRNGRQAAVAVCVARLEGAMALVCLSERAIIVTHGREARTVSRIDPTQPASKP